MADINLDTPIGRVLEAWGQQLKNYFSDATVDDVVRCPGDLDQVVNIHFGQPVRGRKRGLVVFYDWTDLLVDPDVGSSSSGTPIVSQLLITSTVVLVHQGRSFVPMELYRADGVLYHLRLNAFARTNWIGHDKQADGQWPDDIRGITVLDGVNTDTIEGYTGRSVVHQVTLTNP